MSTHAYCPNCREESAIDRKGNCLWCDQPTGQGKKRGKPTGVYGKLTDDQLKQLHQYHVRGVSIRELGRQVWNRFGFASDKSAAMAISSGFKRLHLASRDRVEATVQSNVRRGAKDSPGTANQSEYKRWLRKKHGGMRPCQGVRSNYPRKGEPCQRYAQKDSDYCLNHDPERREEVIEIVRRAREAA